MPAAEPLHVLVTEDDPAVRTILHELLKDAGYRVSLSALQDVPEVARLAPDLILLDYWDAGTGLAGTFLECLKADPRTAAVPLIVLTGAHRQVQAGAAHLVDLGVTVVLKPFDIDNLLAEVARGLLPRPG